MDFHNDGSTSDPLSLLESFQTLDQTKVFILEAQMTGRFTCNPTIDNGSDAWGSPKKNSCLILREAHKRFIHEHSVRSNINSCWLMQKKLKNTTPKQSLPREWPAFDISQRRCRTGAATNSWTSSRMPHSPDTGAAS